MKLLVWAERDGEELRGHAIDTADLPRTLKVDSDLFVVVEDWSHEDGPPQRIRDLWRSIRRLIRPKR